MTNLVPRDSFFQDLFDIRRDFDQIFNRFLSWPSTQEEAHLSRDSLPLSNPSSTKTTKNSTAR